MSVIGRMFAGDARRMALYENIWPDTLRLWVSQGYPTDGDRPRAQQDVFGYDLGRIGAAFDSSPRAGYRRVIERSEAWELVEDGAGAIQKRWLDRSATPGHVAWRMTDEQVWQDEFRGRLLSTDDKRIDAERLSGALERERQAGRFTCFNMSFIWENFRQAVGDETMYVSLVCDKGWVRDYNAVTLDFYKRHIDRALELVGVPDGCWFSEDLAYNQGLFCSPDTLRELYMPFYAELNAFLHARGMKVFLHSCGNVTQALPLICEAGFDALHPMQVKAGVDAAAVARTYADKLVLMGGMPVPLLETGDACAIAKYQRELLQNMRDTGARYIFCSDHSISTRITYDTYRRVVESFREFDASTN